MVKWDKVFSNVGSYGVDAVRDFVDGNLNCEEVQEQFRNIYSDASAELRRVIRDRGTNRARVLAKRALRRRNLV